MPVSPMLAVWPTAAREAPCRSTECALGPSLTPLRFATMTPDQLHGAFMTLPKAPEDPCPKYLYHYTTAEGLYGILQSGQLWATHSDFTNDRFEMKHADSVIADAVKTSAKDARGLGRDVLTGFLEKHPEERVYAEQGLDLYVACLSTTPDSLGQWRAYADNGRGYAIGIDTTHGGARPHPYCCRQEDGYAVDIFQVTYSADAVKVELQSYVAALLAKIAELEARTESRALFDAAYRHLRVRSAGISVRLKHEGFLEEREWRLVVVAADGAAPGRFLRTARGLVVPSVRLDLSEKPSALPIHRVYVGPAHAAQGTERAAIKGVRTLLEGKCSRAALPGIVMASSVPYRA